MARAGSVDGSLLALFCAEMGIPEIAQTQPDPLIQAVPIDASRQTRDQVLSFRGRATKSRFSADPLLIRLPIGFWVASLVFDILNLSVGGSRDFTRSASLCMALGIVGAAAAVPAGLAKYSRIPAHTIVQRIGFRHLACNLLGLVAFSIGWIWRRTEGFGWGPFALSCGACAALAYSGYLGGRLVYDYRIRARSERGA